MIGHKPAVIGLAIGQGPGAQRLAGGGQVLGLEELDEASTCWLQAVAHGGLRLGPQGGARIRRHIRGQARQGLQKGIRIRRRRGGPPGSGQDLFHGHAGLGEAGGRPPPGIGDLGVEIGGCRLQSGNPGAGIRRRPHGRSPGEIGQGLVEAPVGIEGHAGFVKVEAGDPAVQGPAQEVAVQAVCGVATPGRQGLKSGAEGDQGRPSPGVSGGTGVWEALQGRPVTLPARIEGIIRKAPGLVVRDQLRQGRGLRPGGTRKGQDNRHRHARKLPESRHVQPPLPS